jgi:predicted transcriptional regulator
MGQTQDDQQSDSGTYRNDSWPKYFGEDYLRTKKQTSAIRGNRDLIEVLQSDQPLASTEIAEAMGMSKVAILSQLKRLINLNLVCQIKFEHHVYYCINGIFTDLINTSLLE